MITWWKQPGNKTMKRQTVNGTDHVSIDKAKFEIELFQKNGFKITDHGHKITAEKE